MLLISHFTSTFIVYSLTSLIVFLMLLYFTFILELQCDNIIVYVFTFTIKFYISLRYHVTVSRLFLSTWVTPFRISRQVGLEVMSSLSFYFAGKVSLSLFEGQAVLPGTEFLVGFCLPALRMHHHAFFSHARFLLKSPLLVWTRAGAPLDMTSPFSLAAYTLSFSLTSDIWL